MLQLPVHYQAGHEADAPLLFAEYKTTRLRSPKNDLIMIPQRLGEITGPVFGEADVTKGENDMTRANGGEAQGQRIVVHGRVLDSVGRPIPDTLIEVWQANAGGRYRHKNDSWPAPLDPYFNGVARCMTDRQGHYEFTTIKPGAYPWGNHHNAWRPAHIHYSLFGQAFTQRLVTQMYFPDDPFFFQDPIYNSVPEAARERMIAAFDYDQTRENWAVGFKFDIVLRGQDPTPFEDTPFNDRKGH
ncbi:protocatechuate 3,4-dioxygenase subunit beta [Rhodococcus marinonascens]|uniref:protocatechuate 3,4-dioxygenase subunit beta n=1 Tax=Rhodococcus marinonascens TaxID=38311 RepID=UPI0009329639|nr:protocatechuate 3,4-dioxygenase subunit beta [Rhodococcus marinonascens]